MGESARDRLLHLVPAIGDHPEPQSFELADSTDGWCLARVFEDGGET